MLIGEEWKELRSTFSPIFTSGKMKAMTEFIAETSRRLVRSFDKDFEAGQEVDLRSRFNKFSMDTISSCAFGIDAQSFADEDSKFVFYARDIFRRNMTDFAKFIAAMIPGVRHMMGFLGISAFKPEPTLFFYDVVKRTVEHRIETKERRNDLIDLMIDAMKDPEAVAAAAEAEDLDQFEKDAQLVGHKAKKKEFDLISLVATAIIMLVAGYDTTGNTLGILAWVLATNPDIQRRLQEEVDEATEANGGQLPDYKATLEMEYLEMVLQETLRRYSPIAILQRVCNEDWDVPGHPGLKVEEYKIPVVQFITLYILIDNKEPGGPRERGGDPHGPQVLPGP